MPTTTAPPNKYDGVGRRTATVLPLNQRSSMTYDEVGNVKTMTDFNGKTTTYVYDEQNRPMEKQFQDGSKVNYTYTFNGLQDTVTFRDGAGLVTSFYDYDYDGRDRLTQRTDDWRWVILLSFARQPIVVVEHQLTLNPLRLSAFFGFGNWGNKLS